MRRRFRGEVAGCDSDQWVLLRGERRGEINGVHFIYHSLLIPQVGFVCKGGSEAAAARPSPVLHTGAHNKVDGLRVNCRTAAMTNGESGPLRERAATLTSLL